MVVLYDETGLSPLPPGILVTIGTTTPASPAVRLLTETGDVLSTEYGELIALGAVPQTSTTVYTGYTQLGGSVNFTPDGAVQYSASFTGTQAPSGSLNFTGNALAGQDTTVTVTGYRSPTLSQLGYTQEQMNLWVNRIFGDSARQPGGNAYALAYGLSGVLSYLDTSTQQAVASSRVETCQGSALDSWAFDFFGNYLLRYPYESDSIYLSRILTAFGPRCTLSAIQTIVQQYYVATTLATAAAQTNDISFDATGSFDTRGGFDVLASGPNPSSLVPVVTVWDSQSNPALASTYSIVPTQFVIQIAFSGAAAVWWLDHSHLDFETFLASGNNITTTTTPPNAQVGALVSLVKAAGAQPLYQVYST